MGICVFALFCIWKCAFSVLLFRPLRDRLAVLLKMHKIDNFRGECKLGDHVLLRREAIEGIVGCGKVNAIVGLDMGEIIFYV